MCGHWTFTGTNEGQLGDQPATNRSVEIDGLSLYRFEGDRLAESWSARDRLDEAHQLGLVDPEAPI